MMAVELGCSSEMEGILAVGLSLTEPDTFILPEGMRRAAMGFQSGSLWSNCSSRLESLLYERLGLQLCEDPSRLFSLTESSNCQLLRY